MLPSSQQAPCVGGRRFFDVRRRSKFESCPSCTLLRNPKACGAFSEGGEFGSERCRWWHEAFTMAGDQVVIVVHSVSTERRGCESERAHSLGSAHPQFPLQALASISLPTLTATTELRNARALVEQASS